MNRPQEPKDAFDTYQRALNTLSDTRQNEKEARQKLDVVKRSVESQIKVVGDARSQLLVSCPDLESHLELQMGKAREIEQNLRVKMAEVAGNRKERRAAGAKERTASAVIGVSK